VEACTVSLSAIQSLVTDRTFSCVIVQGTDKSFINNRKMNFPDLELAMWVNTEDASLSEYSGDLVIAGSVTPERFVQFLKIPVFWDKDGGRESILHSVMIQC
jgi:hypothetical protein